MKGAPAPDADAIVVGAGPAGAALARRLAGRARVLLLERPARGEDRPAAAWRIGESLPGAAATLLRRSGLY
ncbi:MAG: NAD(P)-binding protein [Tagaea sp.]